MMPPGGVLSPHSHPGMMQQQQQQPPGALGPPVQSPLSRYMMAQNPQGGVYRPQMSPMNMISMNEARVNPGLFFMDAIYLQIIRVVQRR